MLVAAYRTLERGRLGEPAEIVDISAESHNSISHNGRLWNGGQLLSVKQAWLGRRGLSVMTARFGLLNGIPKDRPPPSCPLRHEMPGLAQ
jgi:hypothetical protein